MGPPPGYAGEAMRGGTCDVSGITRVDVVTIREAVSESFYTGGCIFVRPVTILLA